LDKIKFEPLRIRRSSEVIEDSIKEMIVSGQLKVGSRLPTEPEIGKQFGVSLVTVREALRGLETMGIIRKKRGKDGGIFVTEIESDVVNNAVHNFLVSRNFTARDLSVMRDIVEPPTIAIAAVNIDDEEIQTIENNVRYCEDTLQKKKENFSARVFFDIEERNVEFHRLLAEATHNPIIALTVDNMMDFVISFKRSTLVQDIGFSLKTVIEHRQLLEDLKKHDAVSARQHMEQHLKMVDNYLISKEQKNTEKE
jgi:GntR family transcriptional regulator, transcriptional repressor for pyruvate dehydrogenase complex